MGKHILVSSIDSWNKDTGSDTLSSLFDTFDSHDLANIYITGGLPDSKVCTRYFHIDEMSVVMSVLRRRIKTGQEVKKDIDSHTTNNFPKIKLKRLRIFLWARELAWKLGCWKSEELNTFLDDFRPEILVFPIENYPYFNRLNQYIIDRCKPMKVIGYLWDDNFSYKQEPYNIVFKVERYFNRKRIRH